MRIWALVSWFDEEPVWLEEMIDSLAPLVDGVIAVDGRYELYPDKYGDRSAHEQWAVLLAAMERHKLVGAIRAMPPASEVAKRTFMFNVALNLATNLTDWFLIMDGDMLVRDVDVAATRAALAATKTHVAMVKWIDLPAYVNNPQHEATGFRSLFRAIPGMRVEGRHSFYTVPTPNLAGRRLCLWNAPPGFVEEPALDLMEHLYLQHRPYDRDAERDACRHEYYDGRSRGRIEDWPNLDDELHEYGGA